MLSPVEKDFRRKLENRLPSIKNNKIKKADNIVPSTRFAVQELFKLIGILSYSLYSHSCLQSSLNPIYC